MTSKQKQLAAAGLLPMAPNPILAARAEKGKKS